jgi:hypothetical protein
METQPDRPARVSPAEVKKRMQRSPAPLLVCAYDDEAKCRRVQLDGAITLAALEAKRPTLAKDQNLVFYCA